MQTVMRRNAGGNTGSANRGRLTDLYVSPEALEDVRNWGLDQVDEVTRREIYTANEGGAPITRIFGVNLHDLDELGEGQEYQVFFEGDLAGDLQGSDDELVVGLDQSANDSFVMPVKEQLQVYEDPTLHRQQRAGYYGWMEMGFGVLDNRRIILGSFQSSVLTAVFIKATSIYGGGSFFTCIYKQMFRRFGAKFSSCSVLPRGY